MDPGSSKTTCGSSDILINSGPMSCNRGWGKRQYIVITKIIFYHYIIIYAIYYVRWHDNLAHLHFLLIQTHWGVELCQGSWVSVSMTVHVRTTGAAVELLPAAITLPVSTSRGNPGEKWVFHSQSDGRQDLSLMTPWLRHHTFQFILLWGFPLPSAVFLLVSFSS